jgi:hypothetical protein
MKEPDRARARGLAERIRSRTVVDGAFSVFGRLKPEAVIPLSESIAAAYAYTNLNEDDLRRCALLFLEKNPAAGRTHQETTNIINQRRLNEQAKVVVRDVSSALLKSLTPVQKLHYVNSGELPEKYLLKGPRDE